MPKAVAAGIEVALPRTELFFTRGDAMKINRRRLLQLTAGAIAAPSLVGKASAQAWPNRIIRIVVGFPPGGGADAATRIAADKLSALFGQQVVIENRPGAGGN